MAGEPPQTQVPLTPEQAFEAARQAAILADLQRRHQFLPVTPLIAPAPPAPPVGPTGLIEGQPAGPTPEIPVGVAPTEAVPPQPAPAVPPGFATPSFAPPLPMGGPGATVPPPDLAPVPAPPPGMPAPPEQQAFEAEQQRLTMEADLERATAAEDDTLGQGARPRRGSTMEHPLDTASRQLSSELRENAKRLAGDLFPNGPAGTVLPSQEALGAYARRHWDDPQFRQTMLDRMAPRGPDNQRVPWGVKSFMDLYRKHVEPYRLPQQPQQQTPPAAPPPPQAEAGLPPPVGPNALSG